MSTLLMTKTRCVMCLARERRTEIARLRSHGYTFREIGEKLGGVSRQNIYRAWKLTQQEHTLA